MKPVKDFILSVGDRKAGQVKAAHRSSCRRLFIGCGVGGIAPHHEDSGGHQKHLSVDGIELSKSAVEFLHKSNICTLGGLVMKTEGEILKFRGGRSVVAELKQKLETLGLELGLSIDKSLLEHEAGVNP